MDATFEPNTPADLETINTTPNTPDDLKIVAGHAERDFTAELDSSSIVLNGQAAPVLESPEAMEEEQAHEPSYWQQRMIHTLFSLHLPYVHLCFLDRSCRQEGIPPKIDVYFAGQKYTARFSRENT